MKKLIILSFVFCLLSFPVFAETGDISEITGIDYDKDKEDAKGVLNSMFDNTSVIATKVSQTAENMIDGIFNSLEWLILGLYPSYPAFRGSESYNVRKTDKQKYEINLPNLGGETADADDIGNFQIAVMSSPNFTITKGAMSVFKILFSLCFIFACFYCAYKYLKDLILKGNGFQNSFLVVIGTKTILCFLIFGIIPYIAPLCITLAKRLPPLLFSGYAPFADAEKIVLREAKCLDIVLSNASIGALLKFLAAGGLASLMGASFIVSVSGSSLGSGIILPCLVALGSCFIMGLMQMINLYVWEFELYLATLMLTFLLPFTIFSDEKGQNPLGITFANIVRFFLLNTLEIMISYVVLMLLDIVVNDEKFATTETRWANLFIVFIPAILLSTLFPLTEKLIHALMQGQVAADGHASRSAFGEMGAGLAATQRMVGGSGKGGAGGEGNGNAAGYLMKGVGNKLGSAIKSGVANSPKLSAITGGAGKIAKATGVSALLNGAKNVSNGFKNQKLTQATKDAAAGPKINDIVSQVSAMKSRQIADKLKGLSGQELIDAAEKSLQS